MEDRIEPKPYYSATSLSAQFYDAITELDPSTHHDVDFYQSLIGESPKRCLVLGCGTGRVALELALKGHQVIGLDIAESMLKQAEIKRRQLPSQYAQRTKFLVGSMTNSPLPHWFDFVVAPFYGFNHLSGRLERAQALANTSRYLFPGARFALHVLTENWLRDPRTSPPPRRPGLVLTYEEDGSRIEVTWAKRIIEPAARKTTQIVEYRMFSASGIPITSSDERLTYYWIDTKSLQKSAASVGLKITNIVDGFGEHPENERVYLLEKLAE